MSSMGQTDIYGRSLDVLHKFRERDTTASFELDANAIIPTIRGRHVCETSHLSPLEFQETSETFQESEEEVHLENLRLMLRYASPWRKVLGTWGSLSLQYSGKSRQV